MHLTLDALVVLDAIARGGSFARGAERLHRVPSAVSYAVQKLEQDLGITIFNRSGHRAKLTAAGLQLLEEGRELLEHASDIERQVQRAHAGAGPSLTVLISDLVVAGPMYAVLRAFREAPAHRPLELCVEIVPHAACWERLAAGHCDIAVGVPALGIVDDAYEVQALGDVALALTMSPAHPLAAAVGPIDADALAAHCVVRQLPSMLGATLELHGAEYVTVADAASQADAIRHDLGVGYVAWHLVRDDVAAGRLVTREATPAPGQGPTFALVVASRRHARAGAANVAWLLGALRAHELRARLVPQRAT